MCGISGCVGPGVLSQVEREHVSALSRLLTHRGPDGEGSYAGNHIQLSMRRLSIIDLDGGWQPIYNEDRSLAVICNGEIYNYVELTRELKNRGHHFSTQSDVETIVHLYEEYQLDFVKHLRGMFAIALWDDKKKRLILARDRMGEKPIYLVERERTLFFASELKAILKSGLVPLELDPIAVNQYFHFQYVPEPNTIVKGVRKLPAAHILVVDTQPWKVVEHRYWAMEDAPPLRGEPTELIEAELEQVSKIVIRSDVPIGLALSGGVDSAVVASFVVNTYPGILQAFSIGYEGNVQSDERKEAQDLAAHFGVKFHGVEIRDKDMVNFFPKIVFWRDDPIADISGHGYYMVQKAASDAGIKVMLQGQGGDEFFWGYDWVRQALAENRIRVGGNGRSFLSSFEFTGPTGFSRAGMGPFIRSLGGLLTSWAKYKRVMAKPEERVIFYDLSRDFNNASKTLNRHTSRNFQEATLVESPYKVFTIKKPWPALDILMTKLIAETYLLENGVTQGDRLGMASSVELRLPLLDYKLVETVIGLRKSQPDDHLPPKKWLKGAAASRIPEKFLDKPKRGFEPPVRRWHQAIFSEYGDQLRDGFLVKQDVLSPKGAEQLAEGRFNKFDIVPLSFKALVLETWARQMLS